MTSPSELREKELLGKLQELSLSKSRSAFDCASCGVQANLVNEIEEVVAELRARLSAVEMERDELDFILNEGGTFEEQLSAAEARAEQSESALSAMKRELDEALRRVAFLKAAYESQTVRFNCAQSDEALKALEFYRDGFQYHPKRSKTGINLSEWKPKEALLEDCGERARSVLSELLGKAGGNPETPANFVAKIPGS